MPTSPPPYYSTRLAANRQPIECQARWHHEFPRLSSPEPYDEWSGESLEIEVNHHYIACSACVGCSTLFLLATATLNAERGSMWGHHTLAWLRRRSERYRVERVEPEILGLKLRASGRTGELELRMWMGRIQNHECWNAGTLVVKFHHLPGWYRSGIPSLPLRFLT